MSGLAVITPSYGPDAELFGDLHRSVLAFTPEDTVHHVIIPAADRGLFAQYEGPRCRLWEEPELLPRRYRRGPRGLWINTLRPWPPVRGWVIQQTLKLALAATLDADVVLIADSDCTLIRPATAERFLAADGRIRLHRVEKAVTAEMDRHVIWHHVAHRLLGLPPVGELPLTDYVSSLNFWSPAAVRALQDRIKETTGRNWMDAFNAQLHISEFMLYGIFVDNVLCAGDLPEGDPTTCLNRWDRTPLDMAGALEFAERLGPDEVAVMISAKSDTPQDVRQAALDRCAEIATASP